MEAITSSEPTLFKHIDVDYSGLSQWKKCQLAFHFGYNLQLQGLGSANPSSPLIYGSIGHDALQTWYTQETYHDDNAAKMTAFKAWAQYRQNDMLIVEHEDEWKKLIANILANLDRYFAQYKDEPVGCLSAEQPFSFALSPDVTLYGKLDSLILYKGTEDSVEKIWILEHKFYKTIPSNTQYLDWDMQTSTYSLIGRALFRERFGGILYNFIRKTPAKSPDVPLFQRVEIVRPKELLKTVAKFIVVQGRQMAWVRDMGESYIVPVLDNSPMFDNPCTRCTFNRDICKAFREGGDWKAIAASNYTHRTEYARAEEDLDVEEE